MAERIDKILANLGYCSRREVSEYLCCHSVLFRGTRVKSAGQKVDRHEVTIDNVAPDHPDGLFIMLHKPAGYVCSHDDSEGKRVYDLLPQQWMKRNPVPSTVGRLDKDTTGVLIITDLTRLNHQLSSSKKGVEKVYQVTLDRMIDDVLISQFASGTLMLAGESTPCRPAALHPTGPDTAEVILTEGRYHQVKRMFGHFGYRVTALHRSRFGPFTVDSIPAGTFNDCHPASVVLS